MTTRRLDPFTLPAATAARFLLLIVTAIAGSAYVYAWLVQRLAAVSGAPAACARAARDAAGLVPPDQLITWYGGCQRWASLREVGYVATMIGVLIVVTVTIYLLAPLVISRGLSRPELFPAQDVHLLNHVRDEMPGLDRIPILIDCASRDGPGRAFGALGRYRIVVDHRLLADEQRLRSVLAHEYAHIRNRDIDVTYLTIAFWWAYLCVAAVPFVLVALSAPGLLADASWRLAALLSLLYVIRASVLRTREYYADARAAEHPEVRALLLATLQAAQPAGARRTGRVAVNHPTPGRRCERIEKPQGLFRMSPATSAATGILIGLAYPPVAYVMLLSFPRSIHARGWAVGLLFGLLAAGALAGSIWRAALASWAHGEPAPSTRANVLALTAGVLGGLVVAPALPGVGSLTTVLIARPAVGLAVAALLAIGVHGFYRWTVLCAATWLPLSDRPRRAARLGVAQAGLVVGVWLATWFTLIDLLAAGGSSWGIALIVLLSVLLNPVLLLSVVWACGYPLAGARGPLAGVYVTAIGTLLLYAAAVVPFYPQLRRAITLSQAESPTRAGATLLPIALLLLLPALGAAVAGALVLGVTLGGRRRTGQVLAAGGCSLLLSAVGLVVVALAHLTLSMPLIRPLPVLLAGLSGVPVGQAGGDAPDNPSLGLMITLMYGTLLMVGLPATLLGSGIRALWPDARPDRPARPRRRVVALLTPLALVTAGFGCLAVSEWVVPQTISVPVQVDRAAIETTLAAAGTSTVPVRRACGDLIGSYRGFDPADDVDTGLATGIAAGAAIAMSADDATLNTMAEGTVDALRLSELRRAGEGLTVMLQYCAATLGRP